MCVKLVRFIIVYFFLLWSLRSAWGKRHHSSLALKVNQAITSFMNALSSATMPSSKAIQISSTIQWPRRFPVSKDSDIRGALRLAACDDVIAPFDELTVASLRTKHPSTRASDSSWPAPSSYGSTLCLPTSCCYQVLCPHHLKDLTSASAGEAGHRGRRAEFQLVRDLTSTCLRMRLVNSGY